MRSGTRSGWVQTAAHFVIGFMIESWSSSCSAPCSACTSGRAPPSTTSGVWATLQFATAVTIPVTPGPDGDDGDAAGAVHPAPGFGGVRGGLLVADVEHADALERGSPRRSASRGRPRA